MGGYPYPVSIWVVTPIPNRRVHPPIRKDGGLPLCQGWMGYPPIHWDWMGVPPPVGKDRVPPSGRMRYHPHPPLVIMVVPPSSDPKGPMTPGVDRHTDTCQNVTFPCVSYVGGKNQSCVLSLHDLFFLFKVLQLKSLPDDYLVKDFINQLNE